MPTFVHALSICLQNFIGFLTHSLSSIGCVLNIFCEPLCFYLPSNPYFNAYYIVHIYLLKVVKCMTFLLIHKVTLSPESIQ